MKLVPTIMDYCLLQFDAIKYFLRVRLYGDSQTNFNFFNANPHQIFQRNRKVISNCLEANFYRQQFSCERTRHKVLCTLKGFLIILIWIIASFFLKKTKNSMLNF